MIVDTNALSALLLSDGILLRAIGNSEPLHLPVIVLGEYRFGLGNSRERERLGLLLDEIQNDLDILPVDAGTVQPYARIRLQLKKAGTPLPQNDVWIGALAMQYRVPVLSRDKHFDAIEGIERRAW